jgi:hypothetical protein
MELMMLAPEQQEALKFAFKVIKGEKAPVSKKESEIIIFINNLFGEPTQLKKAWNTSGFPFEKINSIFEDFTGKEHPVFVELFGGSFISSMTSSYRENLGECGAFLPDDIKLYCLPGKIVVDYLKSQEILT